MRDSEDWFRYADMCPCEGCISYCKKQGIKKK